MFGEYVHNADEKVVATKTYIVPTYTKRGALRVQLAYIGTFAHLFHHVSTYGTAGELGLIVNFYWLSAFFKASLAC